MTANSVTMINIVTVLTASSGVLPSRRFIWAVKLSMDTGAINDVACPIMTNIMTLASIGRVVTDSVKEISTTAMNAEPIPAIMHTAV